MARRHRRPARHAAPASSPPKSTLFGRSLHCERLEDRRLLAVVTVDTELDLVDFNDGKASLREAIFATNTVPGADEIRFDFGHDGPATILLTHGELAIADAVSIVGAGVGWLTIDGQLSSRLFNIDVAAGDVTFRGLTLTRGQTTGDNATPADLTNQTHGGGAIRSVSSGLLTLDQVDVAGNGTTGANAAGGALYVTGPLAITASKVRGNNASGASAAGGGLAATGVATITASTFSGNRAARGGGVSATSALAIGSSTFSGNRAVDAVAGLGGAVYATGTLHVVNSTISTNAAQSVVAAQGAGLWVSGATTIAHSTIVANTASTTSLAGVGSGGGLYGDQAAGETLTVNHTIIGGNFTTEENGEVRFGSGSLELRYSLIADNGGTNLSEAPIGWPDAHGNLIGGPRYGYVDPLLNGLEENGGPTRTHALLPGSPAVFAGDMALVPGVGSTPEFDQRGAPYSRRVGTRMAIGAVESSVTPIIVDSLADESDGNFGPGELTLREALELANGRVGIDAVEFSPALFAARPQRIALTHGELRITDEMDLRGPGALKLTVDAVGNDKYPDRAGGGTSVFVIADSSKLVAKKVRVADLSVTGAEEAGIRSEESLTLIGVNVYGNVTSRAGATTAGGVTAFELFVIASRVVGNDSQGGCGGIFASGQLVIERSIVVDNGSLIPFNGASVGGIGVRRTSFGFPPSTYELTIIDSDISGNLGWEVGGVRSEEFAFLMANSNLSENYGHTIGGADVQSMREFGIWNSSINKNSSRLNASGIRFIGGNARGDIEHTTISGNGADTGGAALVASGVRLNVRHSTIANNLRSGISLSGSLTIEHSIVAGNGLLGGSDLTGGALTLKHSVVGDKADNALSEAPVGTPDANGNLIGGPLYGTIDPLLAPLADNGGPALPGGARLLTHALLPSSPAIDAGDPTLVPGEGGTPAFDQRGAPYARLAGQRVDLGAIERQEVGMALGADFNFDGVVDGSDFLAWQRGFGAAPGSFPAGDATEDGVVDGADLGVWQDRFGDDGTPSAVATTAPFSTGEAVAEEQPGAIRFDLADAALRSLSILNRLDRPAIDLRSLNGLELSQNHRHASPTRSVKRPSDRPDAIREATKRLDHRRGEREAGQPISLESLDRSFAEETWLDSEPSNGRTGILGAVRAGILPRMTEDSQEHRSKT